MELVYAFLIIIILSGLLAILYVSYYNKLQDAKIKIDEAESIIDENLRQKYDYLISIKNIIIKESKDKKISFKDLEELKDKNISNFDFDRELNTNMELINQILNDYPKLEANDNIQNNIYNIKKADEKIDSAKLFYNKYITESNSLTLKFPSNIVARFHNIEVKKFFDNKNLNDEDINDFKL